MPEPADKRYHVIISDRAGMMLAEHALFVAQVSPVAAENLRLSILKGLQGLEFLPQRYPWFSSDSIPANKYRKLVIEKRYLALYQIRDDVVLVDLILDCRQEYQWLI